MSATLALIPDRHEHERVIRLHDLAAEQNGMHTPLSMDQWGIQIETVDTGLKGRRVARGRGQDGRCSR